MTTAPPFEGVFRKRNPLVPTASETITVNFPDYGKHCGVVIQSMLRRSADDIEGLIALGARVRLCKGAYLESEDVAFPDKADVDRSYLARMERLLTAGN